jgi:hypothetical protein
MNPSLLSSETMKRLKIRIGVVISILAVLLPFGVVWLSARQFVPSDVERSVRFWCGVGALAGPLCAWDAYRPQKLWDFLLVASTALVLLSAVCGSSFFADRMFAHWMLTSRSPAEWQQMANDVYGLARETADQKNSRIDPEQLPETVRHLGRADHCWGADCKVDTETDQVYVQVFYGNRYRQWGLRIGSPVYLGGGGHPRGFSVATNAQFYVGTGP